MDWKTKLETAIENKPTQDEQETLELAANDWAFCYIGENRQALTDAGFEFATGHSHTFPNDNDLYNLGLAFSCAIEACDYKQALEITGQIDTLVLLRKKG